MREGVRSAGCGGGVSASITTASAAEHTSLRLSHIITASAAEHASASASITSASAAEHASRVQASPLRVLLVTPV